MKDLGQVRAGGGFSAFPHGGCLPKEPLGIGAQLDSAFAGLQKGPKCGF